MTNVSPVDRLMELLPEETRLIHQVKFGDVSAFVKLYDAYVERIHRYIYVQVANNRAVEGLTFQTFFTAWKQLNEYKETGLPFISWLYSIARGQVHSYLRTHGNSKADVQEFLVSTSSYSDEAVENIREALQFFTEEERQVLILKYIVCMPVKGISRLMNMREGNIRNLQDHALQMLTEHLEKKAIKKIKIKDRKFQRVLVECQVKLLNETATQEELLARYPEYAAQLSPLLQTVLSLVSARNVNPLPTFTAYTREALLHYMVSHPRRQQRTVNVTVSWRLASVLAVLIVALLATGTAQAQSALPGEPLYNWKRASELVWRAISLDPVSIDIVLAERRIDEWIAVADDPERSSSAMDGYMEAISRLQSANAEQKITRIVPALRTQQQVLNEAGLRSNELDIYLVDAASIPASTSIPPLPTATRVLPTQTENPPTATRIPSTATDVPSTVTEIPPTATNIPPTATNVPPTATEIPPTATDVPPTATEVSPTETEVPTEVPPEPTEVPPTSTPEVPVTLNNDSLP